MAQYCNIDDVQNVLPKKILVGTNLLEKNVNITQNQVEFYIEQSSGIVDAYVSTIYRVPIVPWKEPDFTQDPVTFVSQYPPPIVLITARLAAANVYDKIVMSQQEPNVSVWGKNQRALAFDDLRQIQSGIVRLRGQTLEGMRFVPQELFDPSRVPFMKSHLEPHGRAAGE